MAWPSTLWLIRHGESAGNVAALEAEASGVLDIGITDRDVDVPLSGRGEQQADALGRWAVGHPPTIVLCSPYKRAVQTARGLGPAHIDERLREKEFGRLDRLTRAGIASRYPAEVEARAQLGKFYYRPPCGESWCDVIQRLRGVMLELQHNYRDEHVAIVGHQVVVLCFRYRLENLDEHQLLSIDREGDVLNCSVTSYRYDPQARDGRGGMALQAYNSIEALDALGAPVTAEPDRKKL